MTSRKPTAICLLRSRRAATVTVRYENIKDTEDKKFSTAVKVTSCLDVFQFEEISVDFNVYINELPILEY